MKIPLSMIESQLVVEFDRDCLKVPEVTVGMDELPKNDGLLRAYQTLLMDAQTKLDVIQTWKLPELGEGTSDREKEVFETLRKLNAEVVLRILTMRRIIVAARTRR